CLLVMSSAFSSSSLIVKFGAMMRTRRRAIPKGKRGRHAGLAAADGQLIIAFFPPERTRTRGHTRPAEARAGWACYPPACGVADSNQSPSLQTARPAATGSSGRGAVTSDEMLSELLVERLLKVKRRLASFVGAAVQARHRRLITARRSR